MFIFIPTMGQYCSCTSYSSSTHLSPRTVVVLVTLHPLTFRHAMPRHPMRASRIWMQRSASLEISTVKRRKVKTPEAKP